MSKPKLQRFHQLAPLIVQKYERYLPTAFDESLTLLEKVNKVIEYANQIGKLSNDVVEQWNDVMEWITNEGLEEATGNELLVWLEDGRLDTVINQTILGSKARIIVSQSEPTNPDKLTFWYEDKGETPVNFDENNSSNEGGIVVSMTEPSNTSVTWYNVF